MPVHNRDKLKILRLLNERGKQRGVIMNEVLKMASDYTSVDFEPSTDPERSLSATQEEVKDCWAELQSEGFIRSVGAPNESFFCLTEKGERLYEELEASQGADTSPVAFNLADVVCDQVLLARISDLYLSWNYEEAIFSAFRHVEERLRDKAGLGAGDLGVDLVKKALHPTEGCLRIPSCQTASEEEGVHLLFRGAFQFIKNPGSHRTINWNDSQMAGQAIVFADLLLRIIDEAAPR